LALFLKKNSFIPSKKAQEVEFGFKRCNSRFSGLGKNQQIYGEGDWVFKGKEVPLSKVLKPEAGGSS